MSVSTAQLGDLCVTTTVLPASDAVASALKADASRSSQSWTPEITKAFKKLHMKALSVVLILIALLQISFGVIMMVAEAEHRSLTVRSGAYIWGGLVAFVAGSITVAVETKDSIPMIKACLGSHVTNAVVGGVAMILFMVQLYTETQICWATPDTGNLTDCFSMDDNEDTYYEYTDHVTVLRVSVISMILLYSLVGLIISLCVVVSGWKVQKDVKYSMLN